MNQKFVRIMSFSFLGLILCSSMAMAQGNEWQDPQVNAVNRLPMHTSFFSYESESAAMNGNKTSSVNYFSLDGTWKFNWAQTPAQRPVDFFKVSYNDTDWKDIPVPGIWEVNGYGDPIYF